MNGYAGDEFLKTKKWVARKIEEGVSWEDITHLCVSNESEYDEFDKLQNEELIIPQDMEYSEWTTFVRTLQEDYTQITDIFGIGGTGPNSLPVPTGGGTAWAGYKNYLLGKSTGKRKMSDRAVTTIENNCHWILNHLERDTRSIGPVKGLVMGSIQSGKTANMIGLVSMAADYDWNIFVILSGTIDSLRKQTQTRFRTDLSYCGGLSWHVLDYTSDPEKMKDIDTNEEYISDDLLLDSFQDGKPAYSWLHRYVFVCLKNSKRLQNLITWLHKNEARASRMRVIVIDDEADQASINTVKMGEVSDEDEIERATVNRLIINLVKGCDRNGNILRASFQAMNYISYTATPYANVLNEAYADSLYPNNFICSLPESDEYFGTKAIWGSKHDENYSGLNIIRTIPEEEVNSLKLLHSGLLFTLPNEFQNSLAWFLCAAAIMRLHGYKKPISMLIHTTSLQNGHFEEYEVLKNWLISESSTDKIILLCEEIYEKEKNEFRFDDLRESYPNYSKLKEVCDEFPPFDEIKDDINNMLKNIVNIKMGEDKQPIYTDKGIHLCVDNCRANHVAEEGTFLRIVYPTESQLSELKKAPVFIIMGGNTLSRGLTLEGLVCTYFARNVNQADTLMQMARWFGYRSGYELLQRIWMSGKVQEKFEMLEEIDEKLKNEFENFMKKGKSPSLFGPRIMNSSQIAKFLLTSKSKSQNMTACDVDFTGDSYETTKFEDSKNDLEHNIKITEKFLSSIGTATQSEAIESAYVWYNVDSDFVLSDFLNAYKIFDCSPLHDDIPIFKKWITEMNREGKFLKWNVAVAGDKNATGRWNIACADVGKIERTRKVKSDCIDIGSLRSGRDILSDIRVSELSENQKLLFESRKKSGKELIQMREDAGLGDFPLLLLYRIAKDRGKETKTRTKLGTSADVIGFSIVIAGQKSGSDYVKTVHVKMPE